MGEVVSTPLGQMSVRELVSKLDAVYCGAIGAEFMHIPDDAERAWFIEKFEKGPGPKALTNAARSRVLEHATLAESFDKFLGKRYPGKKRFSLEGGESLIPLLKALTQRAGELGTQEIIVGMPHRGRLSVLRNYVGKDLDKLFTEFEDSWAQGVNGGMGAGGGDVKYHRGYSGDQKLENGKGAVHISMLNNPSHLEAVNPVVMGRCRAKQELAKDKEHRKVVSLLLHGDAAVSAQGVVAECLNMSQLEGYTVGGTIHVVVNNQVGFTTDPSDARSTQYCTDIAKIVNAPVLHVNGDEPEAVVWVAKLAAEYRHEFRRDVFIDMVCFRRYGHNEQDEPGYTQPTLTNAIKTNAGPAENYRAKLIAAGSISQQDADAMIDACMSELDAAQTAAKGKPVNPIIPPGGGEWTGLQGAYSFASPKTAVETKTIEKVCKGMGTVPSGFTPHPKLVAMLAARAALPSTKKLSHADAEQIALGTLVLDGVSSRLSGQDCRRGTFTSRHAVLRDVNTNQRVTPINEMSGATGKLLVWDSPLSEYAVMGFDYGYSRGSPKTLVMWEGQFGDFVNGAQILLDQYLASSEVKWNRWAGLVLLLPHGYEGQGPEHSSARLERFLQLCGNDNMEVVYPSTGAQMFHLLRRQALRDFRKPLIVMTPKKYLRAETSTIDELSVGQFRHIIDDANFVDDNAAKNVKRVVYCSGKIYHELAERRVATGRKDVAIVRVEQLYPFHAEMAKKIDGRYSKAAQRVWAQEEPRNQGAYTYIADVFREQLGVEMGGKNYCGRPACASPATGSEHRHKDEQEEYILTPAIGPLPAESQAKPIGETKAVAVGKGRK